MYLITGGAGFIGSNFVNYIQRVCDDEIVVIDSLSYASDINFIKKDTKTTFVWCDIANEKHVNHIFKTYKPKKVFHFAAESHVCLLYTSPSPRDTRRSRMPSSA